MKMIMGRLKENEEAFWNDYVESLVEGDRPKNVFVEAAPAGNFEITDSLLKLYLEGKKWAGSGLVEDFEAEGDPLPQVGNYWIFLGGDREPKIILKTIKTEINVFKDIPQHVVQAEGEGDLSIEYWKQGHAELYAPFLKKWGLVSIDEARVITEYFEIVHK